jgi:hypothetical protein
MSAWRTTRASASRVRRRPLACQAGTDVASRMPSRTDGFALIPAVCHARLAGPLYFGFSDMMTQRAIAQLYTAEELQAALQVRAGMRILLMAAK